MYKDMTREEKTTIMNMEICARLPYGVRCKVNAKDFLDWVQEVFGEKLVVSTPEICEALTRRSFVIEGMPAYDKFILKGFCDYGCGVPSRFIELCLRTLDDMTAEEQKEYNSLYAENEDGNEYDDLLQYGRLTNWLYANHFDFRHLIESGLAVGSVSVPKIKRAFLLCSKPHIAISEMYGKSFDNITRNREKYLAFLRKVDEDGRIDELCAIMKKHGLLVTKTYMGMTDEEKDMLLKDLATRLPYGVKVHCEWHEHQDDEPTADTGELVSVDMKDRTIMFHRSDGHYWTAVPFNRDGCTVKPYLRPIESMTEDERRVLKSQMLKDIDELDETEESKVFTKGICQNAANLDYINAHHLDYRGLTGRDLAYEAPEDMYDINEERSKENGND